MRVCRQHITTVYVSVHCTIVTMICVHVKGIASFPGFVEKARKPWNEATQMASAFDVVLHPVCSYDIVHNVNRLYGQSYTLFHVDYMWPAEGLALSQLNHTLLIYATKCACIVHIRVSLVPTRLHSYTWQNVTTVHAQVPIWYVRLEYKRNHTWLDCICVRTRMPREQVASQHVADSILYTWQEYSVCTWLHWLCTAYEHVYWTVYMYSCSLLDITAVVQILQ